MKMFALLAPLALVAACSQSEPAPEPVQDATPDTVEGHKFAADGGPATGTFEVTSADGKRTLTETFDADGTFTTIEGDTTLTGTWTMNDDGQMCVTGKGEADASCYSEAIADGVWSSVNAADPLDRWTVKRIG